MGVVCVSLSTFSLLKNEGKRLLGFQREKEGVLKKEEEEEEREGGSFHVTIHVSYVGAGVCVRRIYGGLGECGGC